MIDTAHLHARLCDARQAEALIERLYPERPIRRDGVLGWRVGRRGSLSIRIRDGGLVFYDHDASAGGDFISLWARERNIGNGEAIKALGELLGISPLPNGVILASRPASRSVPAKKIDPATVPVPPLALLDMLVEGRAWLWQPAPGGHSETWNDDAIADIARWRGWRDDDVRALVRDGLLTAPVIFGERARAAFPVYVPHSMPDDPGDRARLVGIHARLRDTDGEHRRWRFWPCRDMNGIGVPPFPLVLTDSPGIAWAHLLIVTEGEWDALSLALAAQWIGADKRGLPPAVAIIGLRGVGSWRLFIDAFAPYWPRGVDVLVMRDADDSGERWRRDFLPALGPRCGVVKSVTIEGCKDANDALRAGSLDREAVDELLAVVGRTLAAVESTSPRRLSNNHSNTAP